MRYVSLEKDGESATIHLEDEEDALAGLSSLPLDQDGSTLAVAARWLTTQQAMTYEGWRRTIILGADVTAAGWNLCPECEGRTILIEDYQAGFDGDVDPIGRCPACSFNY